MNRSTLSLLVVAVVLVALVFLLVNPFQDRVRSDNPRQTSLFPVDASRIDGITIRRAGESPVELERRGSDWVVASREGFPADTAMVSSMIRTVTTAQAGAVVSRNPDRQADLQVDDTGVGVEVRAGGQPVAEFVVGKTGPEFTASYVRPKPGDDVYLVRGVNRNLFDRSRGYRDLTLLSFPWEDIAELQWAAADTGWTVSRGDTTWLVAAPGAEPATARIADMDHIFRVASRLVADGFFDGDPDTLTAGFDSPTYHLTARLTDGSEHSVRFGARNDRNQHYARRDDRDAVYLVGEWNLNPLRRRAEALLVND